MKFKVVLLKDLADTGKNFLREHGCEVVISKGKTEADFIKDMKGCHGLFVRNEPVTAKMMDETPSLKVIAKHGVGYDNIDVAAATARNIQVVYVPKGNSNAVAEHTIMLLLQCAKRYQLVANELRKGNYGIRFTLSDAIEVKGRTLGLLGYGNIARAVAKKAAYGLDMRVIAYDPHIKMRTGYENIILTNNKEDVLRQADFLSIHIPSTKETKHSIGMTAFKMMKPTAYIINTARGDILHQEEFVQALKEGVIKGAGLDVCEEEPVEAGHELLGLEEVIMTPHSAGMTIEASDELSLRGAVQIVDVLNHRAPEFPVNTINQMIEGKDVEVC